MSKKIPIGIALALLLVAVAATGAISVNLVINHYNELIVDLPQRVDQYSELAFVEELARREYYGEIDPDSVDESLAKGFLAGLNDSFCYYISADDFEDYSNLVKGIMPGTGISAYFEKTTNRFVVESVVAISPAADTPIKAGFQIVSVNGTAVSEKNADEQLEKITSEYSGKVKLSYLPADAGKDAKPSEIEIECGYYRRSCISSTEDNIGYIRVAGFYESTVTEFRNAIDSLTDSGVKSVVLDLRNASGADLDVAAEIIDMIVPVGNEGTGAIFTARNSSGEIIKQASSDSEAVTFNFAVLVNDKTACAAELIACDLRDFGKAVLVGERTSGHGSMQDLFRLEDGSAITLTIAEILPYTSDSFNGVGLTPDLEVGLSESLKNQLDKLQHADDPQYQAAVSYLKSK